MPRAEGCLRYTVIVDLKWEDPTRSGFPIAMGFTQPQLEALLERTVIERGIPLIRGYGEQNPF